MKNLICDVIMSHICLKDLVKIMEENKAFAECLLLSGFSSPAESGSNIKETLGVAGYGGNYRRRTGPELYSRPLCDCCFFLSTLATLIAQLMVWSSKTDWLLSEEMILI